MKTIIKLFTATLILFATACEGFEDFLYVTFEDVEIVKEIDISLSELASELPSARTYSLMTSSDTVVFQDSLILNMNVAEEQDSSEYELAEYLEQITSIDIDTLAVEILSSYDDITLPEEFEIVTLNVSFSNEDSVIHTESHQAIKAGDKIISPVTAMELSGISSTLQANKDLKVKVSGTVIGHRDIDYFKLKTIIIADVKTNYNQAFSFSEE